MRKLTKREVAAMWLWPAAYAESGMSAIEWYKALGDSRRRLVEDFFRELEKAKP